MSHLYRNIVLLYAVSLWIAIVGSYGLFGYEPDAMASVFLIFIGVPWSFIVIPFTFFDLPIIPLQIFVGLAPLVNVYVLIRLCETRAERK